ncbi:ATP synthase subunit delta', mitochondrial-like protein [Tanacetum coccineum]|uniref:fructose-bisphosphate aldolase n=1 Tax=Tanacetum coccineum TaxID=301880 RepID=A0ABQ4WP02_9ASTR
MSSSGMRKKMDESLSVDMVIVPAIRQMGILPRHVPTIAELKPCLLSVHEGNDMKKYFISSGFAFVYSTSYVNIFAVEAIPLDRIDPEIVVTNGWNAILRQLDIAHHAAKVLTLNEYIKSVWIKSPLFSFLFFNDRAKPPRDEEVSDGNTSVVVVLDGQMLHVAEAFIDKKYHPTRGIAFLTFRHTRPAVYGVLFEGDFRRQMVVNNHYTERSWVKQSSYGMRRNVTPEEIVEHIVTALRRTVPAVVRGVVFLSGWHYSRVPLRYGAGKERIVAKHKQKQLSTLKTLYSTVHALLYL